MTKPFCHRCRLHLAIERVAKHRQLALSPDHARNRDVALQLQLAAASAFARIATVGSAGSFEESAYNGHVHATAGDVLIHPALDRHGN
jgi:hypothetical protein